MPKIEKPFYPELAERIDKLELRLHERIEKVTLKCLEKQKSDLRTLKQAKKRKRDD